MSYPNTFPQRCTRLLKTPTIISGIHIYPTIYISVLVRVLVKELEKLVQGLNSKLIDSTIFSVCKSSEINSTLFVTLQSKFKRKKLK